MLPITDLTGETRLLTNVKQVFRSRKVNGEKTIQFITIPDEHNEESFNSVDNESRFTFEGEPYIIKRVNEKGVGDKSIKQVQAVHTFFNDMINCFQYNSHTGSQTFFAALTRVFENTPYTFSIIDSFTAETFENFGRDNCLSLFKNVLDRYGAEFRVIGSIVYLETEIGATTNFQLRWKSNIKAIDKEVNTDSLATRIKGHGGTPDNNGVYPIQEEYISPNFDLFGDLHADAVYNENLSTVTGMQAHLEKVLVDEPQLSITVDLAEIEGQVKNEGDRGYIIYDPMKIKLESRVVEITETFERVDKKWKVMKTDVTLANLRNKLTDVTTRFAQTSKRVDRLFEGREGLPYNVLPEAVRIAAEAINNSLSEVEYPPGQGIVLRDPNNPLIMVRLTSAGIGLSIDGGVTYRSAMTGYGIVTNELVAGVIRTNNIQVVGEDDLFYWDGTGLYAYNASDLTKYVRLNSDGLYIAKGAISIERPDGFVVIENGIPTFDLNVQSADPPFSTVDISTYWWSTNSDTTRDCNVYSYEHKGRYLKILFAQYVESGGTCTMSVEKGSVGEGNLQVLATRSTTSTVPENATITVDLGVPDGTRGDFYIRLKSSSTSHIAYARSTRRWLEG